MNLAIIGAGYVGLVTGACLASSGHQVVCVDVDRAKVDLINRGHTPIHEDGLAELLGEAVRNGRLRATTDLADAVARSAVTILAVGTPFDGREIDLKYVREAAGEVGRALAHASGFHVVCVKSTVVPGTTEKVVGAIVESNSGKRAGTDFGLAMNPEFLAEGTAVKDFMSPDRIVIGATDARTAEIMREVYKPFGNIDTVVTTPATAEMIKYAANSFLASVISFANEIGNLCAAVGGIDTVDVMNGVQLDRRLSPLLPEGRVRPGLMSFLHPGTGFGGSCFPKDLKALVAFGKRTGQDMEILDAVVRTNTRQPHVTLAILERAVGPLAGKRIAVLGLAFKPGTDDVRESPALTIIQALGEAGAIITAHDPQAIETARAAMAGQPVSYCQELAAAVNGADGVVLVTSWPEYRALSTLLAGSAVPVIDGRRFLQPADFARYFGIGLAAR